MIPSILLATDPIWKDNVREFWFNSRAVGKNLEGKE